MEQRKHPAPPSFPLEEEIPKNSPAHQPLLDHEYPNQNPPLRRQSSVYQVPQRQQQQQSDYDKKVLGYIGQLVLTAALIVAFVFIEKPSSSGELTVQLWCYLFLGSYFIRVGIMWIYLRTVWTQGFVTGTCQFFYVSYHLVAFSLFIVWNVKLFSNHTFSTNNVYDIMLIVIVAIGYIFYYEFAIILLVLFIIVPIFCCVACCCPQHIGNNSWTPTPQSIISRLTRTQFQEEQHQNMKECVICQEDYKEGDQLITLDCDSRHYFHEQCIEEWLKRNNLCPICRMPVSVLGRSMSRV